MISSRRYCYLNRSMPHLDFLFCAPVTNRLAPDHIPQVKAYGPELNCHVLSSSFGSCNASLRNLFFLFFVTCIHTNRQIPDRANSVSRTTWVYKLCNIQSDLCEFACHQFLEPEGQCTNGTYPDHETPWEVIYPGNTMLYLVVLLICVINSL